MFALRRNIASEPLVTDVRTLRRVTADLQEHKTMLVETDDQEMRELIREEIQLLETEEEQLNHAIAEAIRPRDPRDKKNIIMEIRAGAGGEEASLFGMELYRMYAAYAEQRGWQVELIDLSETDMGGAKEVVFEINGSGAFSRLKFESGVHRVQRVPVTEAGGRIHTSTVTVAVLPEADEVDLVINPDDLQIDTYRASCRRPTR